MARHLALGRDIDSMFAVKPVKIDDTRQTGPNKIMLSLLQHACPTCFTQINPGWVIDANEARVMAGKLLVAADAADEKNPKGGTT